LGLFTKRIDYRFLFVITFGATALGLIAMSLVGKNLALVLCAAFVVGFFIIGCQFLLYGVSPLVYPVQMRATGGLGHRNRPPGRNRRTDFSGAYTAGRRRIIPGAHGNPAWPGYRYGLRPGVGVQAGQGTGLRERACVYAVATSL
jgi:hypothetical protein